MLLQEPAQSPYDLRFQLLGFPVRVSWTFWLAASCSATSSCKGSMAFLTRQSGSDAVVVAVDAVSVGIDFDSRTRARVGISPERNQCVDRAVSLRRIGDSDQFLFAGHRVRPFIPKQDIWISFAGPLAQIASAVVLSLRSKLRDTG